MIFNHPRSPERIFEIFSKIDSLSSKTIFHFAWLYKIEKSIFKHLISETNLFLNFRFYMKRVQQCRVWDYTYLFKKWIFHTRITFEKINILRLLQPKFFKNKNLCLAQPKHPLQRYSPYIESIIR